MSSIVSRLFIILSLAFAALHSATLYADSTSGIAVTATGSSHVMPDIARFSVTFQQTADKVSDAQKKVDSHVKDLMAKLSKYQLEEDSIDTSYTRVNPIYTYHDGERKLQGYEVSRSVQFETKELDQIEAVVSTLTSLKVSRLEAIHFALEDESEARAAALNDAIGQSKNAAQLLSSGYGVELGSIVSIEHVVEEYRRPAPMQQARALMVESSKQVDNSYQIKALKFNARVAVTYSIN